jgi:hypothetical protein
VDSAFWRELVARYHYLGYRLPVGAQLLYLVHSERTGQAVLACLQWTSAAWKMAARDRWIDWSDAERARNLVFIVNNSRFLILPWVRVKRLASKILAQCGRQLPGDLERRYGYPPLLLETLVDGQRFTGACHRAATWRAGRNHRAGPDGPLSPSRRLGAQADLRLSPLRKRAATAPRGLPAVLRGSRAQRRLALTSPWGR